MVVHATLLARPAFEHIVMTPVFQWKSHLPLQTFTMTVCVLITAYETSSEVLLENTTASCLVAAVQNRLPATIEHLRAQFDSLCVIVNSDSAKACKLLGKAIVEKYKDDDKVQGPRCCSHHCPARVEACSRLYPGRLDSAARLASRHRSFRRQFLWWVQRKQ